MFKFSRKTVRKTVFLAVQCYFVELSLIFPFQMLHQRKNPYLPFSQRSCHSLWNWFSQIRHLCDLIDFSPDYHRVFLVCKNLGSSFSHHFAIPLRGFINTFNNLERLSKSTTSNMSGFWALFWWWEVNWIIFLLTLYLQKLIELLKNGDCRKELFSKNRSGKRI